MHAPRADAILAAGAGTSGAAGQEVRGRQGSQKGGGGLGIEDEMDKHRRGRGFTQ